MKYRNIGKWGARVSEISLGSWLTYGGAYGSETTKKCVRKAYDLGINYFDTADQYGYDQTHAGAAEEALGDALKGIQRSSYILATKTFWPVGDGANDRGLSRKHIVEQCNASLKRLNTDYIDIFYCHRYDTTTPLTETLRALDDLVRQGKILYVGVSEWDSHQIQEGIDVAENANLNPIVIDQPCYNMFHREIEKEVIPICDVHGLGVAVWSPLAQGVLTGKYKKGQKYPAGSRADDPAATNDMIRGYLEDKNLSKVEELSDIAKNIGAPLSNLAIAWILSHKQICSVIIGASKPEQIEENVKAIELDLDDTTLAAIERILER